MTSEEIVAAYKIKKPRASTNRAVVAELAAKSGKTIAQVRGILIFNHVYISTPDHERLAPDGTELKTSFSGEESREVWEGYLSADPVSADDKKSTINEIAARLKATPYAVEQAIELPMRPRTIREHEDRFNEEALLEYEFQRHRRAARNATIKRMLSISFCIIAIAVFVYLIKSRNDPTSPTSLPVAIGGTESNSSTTDNGVVKSRPVTGMDADSERRYEKISPEGQDYVRDQMKKYDELCAKSNDC